MCWLTNFRKNNKIWVISFLLCLDNSWIQESEKELCCFLILNMNNRHTCILLRKNSARGWWWKDKNWYRGQINWIQSMCFVKIRAICLFLYVLIIRCKSQSLIGKISCTLSIYNWNLFNIMFTTLNILKILTIDSLFNINLCNTMKMITCISQWGKDQYVKLDCFFLY